MPVLEDVFNILKENPDTKRLANIMNRLVHGSASTFNQQTNVNLENKYTVLDISELTGDLLTVGMFVVLDYVWDKAKEDRTVEKAIFIDEIWHLIGAASNRLAAEFVLEIFLSSLLMHYPVTLTIKKMLPFQLKKESKPFRKIFLLYILPYY